MFAVLTPAIATCRLKYCNLNNANVVESNTSSPANEAGHVNHDILYRDSNKGAYSCLCFNAVQSTSLQTADMTDL